MSVENQLSIMMTKVKPWIISKSFTIKQALKRMDEIDQKLLIIMEGATLINVLSIGDIQRAIIKNESLETNVLSITRNNPRLGKANQSRDDLKKLMIEFRMEVMPIIDDAHALVDVIFWSDIFKGTDKPVKRNDLNLPVVIMAGGFGSRLKPITNVIPKALIPLGNKTMLELIMDNFKSVGCNTFHLSVNYKADFIKYYFDQLGDISIQLSYFQEDKPLGTAGSLSLLKGQINETFFVSNCDILIEQDLSEIFEYHRENANELTVVAVLKSHVIPYGTLETGENGQLLDLVEKPEFLYKINSGIYILEPHLLNEIPENTFYHITELMDKLIKEERKIGVFPVNQNSWKDVGTWTEYAKASNLNMNE